MKEDDYKPECKLILKDKIQVITNLESLTDAWKEIVPEDS